MEVIVGPGDILSTLCKLKNRWGMYVGFGWENLEDMNEVEKAAPYLKGDSMFQVRMNGYGYLFFNTQEELDNHYKQTVGDDGPTDINSYNGPARVYALTCDPAGELMSENT
jgi:hypothetical protein